MDYRVAYLAGLIDGDGSFYLGSINDRYRPILQINMTDKRTIMWVAKQFGGTIADLAKPDSGTNNEQQFQWRMKARDELMRLVPELLNFLITKKLQAMLVLEFCTKFNAGKGNRYSEEEKWLMKKYSELMRELNTTGYGSNERKEELRLKLKAVG
jgi:hypothetical protein